MLSIGNKKYRNLQEQVGYNTECIKKLDEYLDGIRVEDKLVAIESDSGTFTDEELVVLSGPLAFISNGSRVWMKDSETLVEFVYKAIDIKADEVGSVYYNIGGSKIVVNRETGAYNTSFDTIVTIYNKDQIDSIVANVNAIKADKSELNSGLALKANVSGQAFTGPITSPSIIEDMNGYVFSKSGSYTNIEREYVYAGVVKTGNKITFAIALNVTNVTGTQEAGWSIGRFYLPDEVMNKLFPTKIGNYNFLSIKKVQLYPAHNTTPLELNVYAEKGSGYVEFKTWKIDNLIQGTKYFLRFDETFLVSDNLAS